MNRRPAFQAISLLFLVSSQLQAGRVISLTPIAMESIHGSGKNNVTYCISANMIEPGSGLGGHVNFGVHYFHIHCRNISNITQTVRVIIENGTLVAASHSNGTPNGVGSAGTPTPGTPFTLSADHPTSPIQIAAKGKMSRTLVVQCSSAKCGIYWQGIGVIGGHSPPTAPFVGQTCLYLNSLINLRLEVEEDRGALSCRLTSSAHRASGQTDRYITPPPVIAFNGGRPF